MPKRTWAYLIGFVLICSIAGTWHYYRSRCHGIDACAALSAEDMNGTHRASPVKEAAAAYYDLSQLLAAAL
jgi:hypothetical protein